MSTPKRRGSGETTTSPTALSPASQYPFPPQDLSRPLNPSQRASVRRGSTVSSVTSIGGVLDSAQGAIPESGQNAISTLLQTPIVRTGLLPQTGISTTGFKAPTTRDIPPVALTNIPHVDSKAFHPYLSQVGSLYDAFQRAKEEGDGESQLFRRERKDTKSEDWDSILSAHIQRSSHSRSGSIASSIGSPIEKPQPKRRTSGHRRGHVVTPLSTVPSVYVKEDFHLEDPRTFDIVSERSEIVRDPNRKGDDAASGRKALATNAILQEKLSWYLDTVEIHLITSISSASKSFFSALGSLRDLHGEAAESVERIQRLRKDLAMLDKEMAIGGLKVVNLKQRRENVRQLGEAVLQLQDIVFSVRKCEDMVERGEIEGALDDLNDVEKLMAGIHIKPSSETTDSSSIEVPPLLDLRNLKALQGATEDLNQLRFRIGKGFEGRFLTSLLGDIRRHVDSISTEVTCKRWSVAFSRQRTGQRRAPSAFPAYMNLDPSFRSELEAELDGLSRVNHTMPAATAFKSSVLREMKAIIRKQLPSSSDDDNESMVSISTSGGRQMSQQEKSSILARNLRALEAEDAHAMLTKIYAGISEGLRRLSVQVKILLDITSGMGASGGDAKSPLKSPTSQTGDGNLAPRQPGRRRATSSVQAELQQVLDLSSLLGEAVDIIQAQITKIVKVRSEQTIHLPLSDFLRFFNLNRLFADECEAISGRSGMSLKTTVDSQIKEFVSQFNNSQKHGIVEVMDADKWDAKDFGEEQNMLLKRVLDGSTTDAPSWKSETSDEVIPNGNLPNGTDPTTAVKDKFRSATIDEQKFVLPDSAMAMLRSLESFLHLCTGMPSMSQEIANGLIECVKLFNSRTSQLILGAGATRSAGLKNITTRHLALSSQALSFVIALIPYIREFFRRHLPPSPGSQTMTEFDKVKRLFQEHQHGVHEKLIEIMSSRATFHINAMKKIDWEQAAHASPSVSTYMEALTKETGTLQKVLAKHLPETTVSMIMVPGFQSYREQWTKAYQEVPVKSMAAKERLLADVEFFNTRISKLEGAGDLGQHLVNVVKAKAVVVPPVGAEMGSAKRSSTERPSTTTVTTTALADQPHSELTGPNAEASKEDQKKDEARKGES